MKISQFTYDCSEQEDERYGCADHLYESRDFSRSDTACIGDELVTKAMSLVAKVRAAELL